MIHVRIDIRERDLWDALEPWWAGSDASKADGWEVVKETLDIGDIVFSSAEPASHPAESVEESPEETDHMKDYVILERKTAEDLGASQRDGRYREQRSRLLAKKGAGTSVGYVVEAPAWSNSLTRTWCRGAFSELHLQNAILRLQLRYGLAVFQAASLKETVQWIRRIAGALVKDPTVFQTGIAQTQQEVAAAYTEAIHVKKASNMDSDRILHTLLRTLPGVGNAAADAIVKHTEGKFPVFYGLSVEDMSTIRMGDGKRKVGTVLATKVWNVFHSDLKPDQ